MKNQVYIFILIFFPLLANSQSVNYNFELHGISEWSINNADAFAISDVNPLSGQKSLKHNVPSGAGTDIISVALPNWDGAKGKVEWRFLLKHGWNPSGSNRWAVFIMCDTDALGVLPAASPSGYAVGVNLNSTDDMLTLYRVDAGVYTSIITSGINWQTDITTDGVGAIEVSRTSDGVFSLKVSANGLFSDIQSQGSVSDLTYAFGGNFAVLYEYTTSAAGLLKVDDVDFTYTPVNLNDHDAIIGEPSQQPPSGIVSSLATDASLAEHILRFAIHDGGTADGLPTSVTKLRFAKVDGTNTASLPSAIGGVVLTNSGGVQVPVSNVLVTDRYIDVFIDNGNLVVVDGSSEEFSLSLYLNPDGIVDATTIQLKVDGEAHGCESHHTGSAFTDVFPAEVVSNLFTIQIIPTHLSFAVYPIPVVVNSTFSVVAHATDAVGNLATSFNSQTVTLSVLQGDGMLSPAENLQASAVDGVIAWNNISYSQVGFLSLKAVADGFYDAESQPIAVINDTTSTVVSIQEQVLGGAISSNANTIGKAVEVFRFGIADLGNNDDEPTSVKQIVLKRPSGDNMASFSRSVAGVVLKLGDEVIPIGEPHILSGSITIPISPSALVVPTADTVEISMSIYLRNGSTIDDGAKLQFMVDGSDHGFLSYQSGSTFAPVFEHDIFSPKFTLDVDATGLLFNNVPKAVGLNQPFAVEVSAVNSGGSVDVDASGNITLAKNLGDGWLSIPVATVSMSKGKAVWSNLKYTYFSPEPFNLLAKATIFNDALSPLIYCADQTTTLTQATSPLPDGNISSLAVTPADAVDVLRFGIADLGDTDELPTRVTQMVFRSQQGQTDANLARALAGTVLRVDNEIIQPQTTTITSESITLTFTSDGFVVPNASSVQVALAVYLNEGGLADGSTISLYIPASGHSWQTDVAGSGFPTSWSESVIGSRHELVVEATELVFVNQPFVTALESSYSLSIGFADLFGNVDVDIDADITLGVDYGPGGMVANPATISVSNGIAAWSNVKLSEVGCYGLKATTTDASIQPCLSHPIWNGASAVTYVDEDFESSHSSFDISDSWSVSSILPIAGGLSLRHGLAGVDGVSSLPIPLSISNLGYGPMEWSFALRNGNWDPSSDNAFWFVLASNQNNFDDAYNGYAVGVNLSGDTDLLSLWRVGVEHSPQLLIQSPFNWDEDETVNIKVTRTPNGEWNLWYQPKLYESLWQLAGSIVDATYTSVASCGPVFTYTASRAGEFWIDDIRVRSAIYPPTIQQARMLSLTSLDIVFTADVDINDSQIASNYHIFDIQGNGFQVLGSYPNAEHNNRVTLRTEELPLEELMLRISGIKSASGASVVNDSVKVGLGAAGTFGNLVINEVMARPSANGGLPNVEYIEILNRTSQTISLNNWILAGNDKYVNLPDAKVEPNGYAVLTSTSGAEKLADYGNVIGVPSFPSLLVSGMFLALHDNDKNLIAWVEYSDTWYGDDTKKAGGFSLERIDANNLVEGGLNWIASSDPSGGTPGRENSVAGNNPDITNPWVTEVKVVGNTQFEIAFSESMDSLALTLVSNYTIDRSIGTPLWATAIGPRFNRVTLTFENAILPREVYNLCFTQQLADFAGNGLQTDCVLLAVPENPSPNDIVVNEILYNPYSGGVDFVEIFNRTEKAFDLSKLWIADGDAATQLVGDYYRAAEKSWLLLPNSYAVLTTDAKLIEQFYYIENPEAMVEIPKLPSYANDGGYVMLLSDTGDNIDAFAYTDDMHNPLLADTKGVSLERIHPDMPTNQSSSWQSAAQTAGFATPTAQNSQFTEPTEAKDEFSLSNKVFSPDGDGYEDYVMMSYELPESGYIANIIVFDSRGRRVKRLAANVTLGTSGSIKWDGTTDGGERVTIGAYVIFIEAFDLRGDIKRYKKTVVVATRFR